MIVIVIVGILSAVALPNFLNQTEKAKAAEPVSQISAAFKNAQMVFIETGASPANCAAVDLPATKGDWSYSCGGTTPDFNITATKGSTDDKVTVFGEIDLKEGTITSPPKLSV